MTPQRRRSADKEALNGWVISLAKAAISLIFLGGLSFIGTFVVGMQSTIASVKEDVQALKEKEKMVTEMIYPNLLEQTRELKVEIRELRKELRGSR